MCVAPEGIDLASLLYEHNFEYKDADIKVLLKEHMKLRYSENTMESIYVALAHRSMRIVGTFINYFKDGKLLNRKDDIGLFLKRLLMAANKLNLLNDYSFFNKLKMNAIILAAGEGRRLMPLTEKIPKALISIKGIPLLKNHIDKLLDAGFKQIAVTCYSHAEQITSFVKHNYLANDILISRESELLGTGGGIKQAMGLMKGAEFLIINADVFSNIDYSELKKYCPYGICSSARKWRLWHH